MSDFVGRVDQIDAEDLDEEFSGLLNSQLKEAVKHFPEWILVKLLPECEVVLEFILRYVTFFEAKSSVGQRLLGLKIAEATPSWKILAWISLETFPKYFAKRWTFFSQHKALETVSTLFSVAKYINYLIFFQEAKYPTLSRRLLSIKLTRTEEYNGREVAYDYMTREVLWHAAMEMLAFLLPLVNISKMKKIMRRGFWPGKEAPRFRVDPSKCCHCGRDIVCASRSNCGHNFCYFCLASSVKTDANFACPACKTHITSLKMVKSTP